MRSASAEDLTSLSWMTIRMLQGLCSARHDAVSALEMNTLERAVCNVQPDMLTLDLCMPNRDRIETLSHLKALGFKGQIIISEQDDWLRKQARDLALARGLNVADEMGNPSTLTRCEACSRGWRARP